MSAPKLLQIGPAVLLLWWPLASAYQDLHAELVPEALTPLEADESIARLSPALQIIPTAIELPTDPGAPEMSEVQAADTPVDAELPEFLHVTSQGRVILEAGLDGPTRSRWGLGPERIIEIDGGETWVVQAVDVNALPERLRELSQLSVQAYGPAAQGCEAQLSSYFELWTGFRGWIEDYSDLVNGEHADDPQHMIASILEQGDTWLVADLDRDGSEDCKDLRWARPTSLPPVVRYAAVELDDPPTMVPKVLRPTVAELEADYGQYAAAAPDMAEESPQTFRERTHRVRAWQQVDGPSTGTPSIEHHSFGFEDGSCGEGYDGGVSGWVDTDQGRRLAIDIEVQADQIEAVFDLDGDGELELLIRGEVGINLYSSAELLGIVHSSDVPYWGCRC